MAEVNRELARAAIAIKRYELRHGKLPEDLTGLVPEFLDEPPHDWLSGESLRYRVIAPGKFLLYSVGSDGKDDSGDPTPAAGNKLGDITNGRDWVWWETEEVGI